MTAHVLTWPQDLICMRPATLDVHSIAGDVYRRTCRTDFEAPGFCILNVGHAVDSTGCRQLMADLKVAMAAIHESRTGNTLIYLSAARFDQQTTTKPHLDGGPEECFLMLGYEPSDVDAELEIVDYSNCAFDHGLSPKELLARHNPIFRLGNEMLRPYATRIPCFSRTDFQIICINNSSAPLLQDRSAWQGALHTATILTPDESKRRVVNSLMIAPAAIGSADVVTPSQLHEFIHASVVRRRGYDKPHLDEDAAK